MNRLIKIIVGFFFSIIYLLFFNKKKSIYICYHAVTDKPTEFLRKDLFVSKKNFKLQINFLCKFFSINKKNEKFNFLITFDDGFDDNIENTLEFLNSKDIEPIFFLNMRTIIKDQILLSSLLIFFSKYSSLIISFKFGQEFVKLK